LGQAEFVRKTPVRVPFFNGVQVFTLDVLDERHFQQLLLVPGADFSNHHRHAVEPGALRRTPAPFTRDDPISAVRRSVDDNRLNHAVPLDGSDQFLEPRLI
jgi:hypothetical protein